MRRTVPAPGHWRPPAPLYPYPAQPLAPHLHPHALPLLPPPPMMVMAPPAPMPLHTRGLRPVFSYAGPARPPAHMPLMAAPSYVVVSSLPVSLVSSAASSASSTPRLGVTPQPSTVHRSASTAWTAPIGMVFPQPPRPASVVAAAAAALTAEAVTAPAASSSAAATEPPPVKSPLTVPAPKLDSDVAQPDTRRPIQVRTSQVVEDVSDDDEPPPGVEAPASAAAGGDEDDDHHNALVILHFNDVYELEARKKEPVGGFARFAAKVKALQKYDPLVVFSGDAMSPSLMSTDTRGKHMVEALNMLGITVAVYGNHDFDHGVATLHKLAAKCNFPWLMSNCISKDTGKPLGNGLRKLVVPHKGRKIGFIGLIEEDWLEALATVDNDDVIFEDFVACAKRMVPELVEEDGVDLVIAVTHMRHPNDERLAREVPELAAILGGHDHDYRVRPINGVWVLNSGCEFRALTKLTVNFGDDPSKRPTLVAEEIQVKRADPADDAAQQLLDKWVGSQKTRLDKVIGELGCDFDARFSSVRTMETNMGNLVADIARSSTQADIALINSGSLRADTVFPAGPFTLRMMRRLLPMVDRLVKLELTGAQLVAVLENGVSKYPDLEGRFPAVSGVRFRFDPRKKSGSRVVRSSVLVNGELVKSSRTYTLCTTSFLAAGHDGFEPFEACKQLIDEENGPCLCGTVRNFFKAQRVLQKWTKPPANADKVLLRVVHKLKLRSSVASPTAVIREVEDRIVCVA